MPIPTTTLRQSPQVRALQSNYNVNTATRPTTNLTTGRLVHDAAQARQIKQLNDLGGFTAKSPLNSTLPRAYNPRPLANSPAVRSGINNAANAFNNAATAAGTVGQQLKNQVPSGLRSRLPAAAKLLNTPLGGGVASAGLSLGISALDGKITGQELTSAAGAGIGATIGALGGPLGAFVGGYIGEQIGNRLGQQLFPNRETPRGEYETLGQAPFEGGQSGVTYYLRYSYTYWSHASNGYTPGSDNNPWIPRGPAITPHPNNSPVVFTGPLKYETVNEIEGEFPTRRITTGFRFYDGNNNQIGGSLRNGQYDQHVNYWDSSIGQWVDYYTIYPQPPTPPALEEIIQLDRADGQPDTGGNHPGIPQTIPPSLPQTTPRIDPTTGQPFEALPEGKPSPDLPGLLPAVPFLPALAPQTTPEGLTTGPGPTKQTKPAVTPGALPKAGARVTPSASPSTGGKGTSPPNPNRTKAKNNCGCNKGILSGVSNLLNNSPLTAANTALLTKIDATTTTTGVRVASNAGILAQTLNIVTTIQQFSKKTWDFLQIDRFLAVANFTFNLHNAYFLSRSLVDSIGWSVDAVLNVIGLGLKDSDDNPISVSELVSEWVETAIDAVVPDETQTEVAETLSKANRIYQAASNLYWQMWSLMDSSQVILETVGQYVGKIGNALRRSGSVMESSYGWMSERFDAVHTSGRRWNQIQDSLSVAEDAISSVGLVAGEVANIQQVSSELSEQRQELTSAIKATGVNDPDSDASNELITANEAELKLDSEASLGLENPDFDPTVAGRPDD